MASTSEIVAREFSYDADARRTFRYIDTYMRLIERRLPDILNDPERRRRFMLAGLFLSYRAANHQGLDLRTTPDRNAYVDERVRSYKNFSGDEIQSTQDYLSKIGYSFFRWLLLGPGRSLYRFVILG